MLPRHVVRGAPNPLHFGFSDRLRRARKAAGLTPTALAQKAGSVSRATVAALEAGENIPRVDTVESLAKALALSPSLLAFGLDSASESLKGKLCDGLPQRLRDTRRAHGLSMRELGRQADASVVLVRSTEAGASLPNLARLEALAKALRVSPAWLAYGEGPLELPPRRRARQAVQSHTSEV